MPIPRNKALEKWVTAAAGVAVLGMLVGLSWGGMPTLMGSSTRTAKVPAAPRTPLFTPTDVLVTSDSTLTLPNSLPLATSVPAPAPSVNEASRPDTGRAPMTAAAGEIDSPQRDSTRRVATAERDTAGIISRDSLRAQRFAQLAEALSEASSPASQRTTSNTPSTADEPPTSAFASAVAGTIPENASDGPGITGLVTDETQTKIGRDFYDAFYGGWQPPEKDYYYTVVVSEQPMPSLGTRVEVRVNQNVVFQTRLQPRYEIIQQAARRAVYMTQRRLQSNLSINAY